MAVRSINLKSKLLMSNEYMRGVKTSSKFNDENANDGSKQKQLVSTISDENQQAHEPKPVIENKQNRLPTGPSHSTSVETGSFVGKMYF